MLSSAPSGQITASLLTSHTCWAKQQQAQIPELEQKSQWTCTVVHTTVQIHQLGNV